MILVMKSLRGLMIYEFDDKLDKLDDELGNELEELEVLSSDGELINDES
jgi:hypothetical protein